MIKSVLPNWIKTMLKAARELSKMMIKALLPSRTRRLIRTEQRRFKRRPPVGWVRFGSLRRLHPIDRVFGIKWGQCIDRYYIESFLAKYATDIQGHVLEIADNFYTCRFGAERVSRSDVLHMTPDNSQATIIADLTNADHILPETFDCIILTQTLQFVYDVRAVIRTLYRILKPGGVLLATIPGISQIARYDMENWGEYWRFTTLSAYKLFAETFPEDCINVQAHGNVLSAISFLHGLVSEELRREELDHHDPDYEMLITVRTVRPEQANS